MKKRKNKDLEIIFFEGLLKERPNYLPALLNLAEAYTRKGFYKEGLSLDRKLAQLLPNDALVHYNLSCSLALNGLIKEAYKALEKAVELGYHELDYILEDPDLENLRKDPYFKDFFLYLKEISFPNEK